MYSAFIRFLRWPNVDLGGTDGLPRFYERSKFDLVKYKSA